VEAGVPVQVDKNGTPDSTPSLATDVLTGVSAITAGFGHVCALMTAGGVRCWGRNDQGQLGDGTLLDRLTPTDTDVLTEVQAITAGYSHTCALMKTGAVRCWGSRGEGQLGDGAEFVSTIPVPVVGTCQ